MKKLFLILLLFSSFAVYSQDTAAVVKNWKKGVKTTLLFSQSSLSNWAAGGENAISTNFYLDLFANYSKGKAQWENNLGLAYGLIKQGDKDFQKNDDKIDLTTKYGYKANSKWFYTALGNFRTQFSEGYKKVEDSVFVSDFFAPAYLTIALGMDYKHNEYLSLFLAPLTAKFTFVNDDRLSAEGAYGVDPGKHSRSEFGGYIKAALTKKLMENVDLATQLQLFSNYLHNPQNIDVDWQFSLIMKINKYLTTNLNLNLIYDDDINIEYETGKTGPRTQFKEVFGAGASFTL